jgi:hypothetical protein
MLQITIVVKIKTYILCSTHFSSENRAVYEVMWIKHDIARQVIGDKIILRMRLPCWITKATDTHSEYVVLVSFSRQQWLCVSMFHLYNNTLRVLLLQSSVHKPAFLNSFFVNFIQITRTDSARTAQWTHTASVIKTDLRPWRYTESGLGS